MNINAITKVSETFKATVRAEVAKGNHARWGEKESVNVIEALFGLGESDADVQAEGFDAIRDKVAEVVNPSAFAQKLETLPDGTGFDAEGKAETQGIVDGKFTSHPAWIRRTKRGGKKSATLDL
jgi:hypothetical protein